MDAALAARFAETDAQRAEVEAEGVRLCTESILAAQRTGRAPSTKMTRAEARKGQRRMLCRLYRALETAELGGQPMHDLELLALTLRTENTRDPPEEKLQLALAAADEHRLELHAAALRYAVTHDGEPHVHELALHTAQLTYVVLRQLHDAARAGGADCAAAAAAAADSVAQLARTGGMAALAALAADARPGPHVLVARSAVTCLYQVVTCLFHEAKSEVASDDGRAAIKIAFPLLLDACTAPPFLARLPVLLGGTFDGERAEHAACLVTFVAHNSPAAVQALLAPDARPALLPLLVAAVWDKRYSAQTLRLLAMRALARLTQVAQPAALAPLVSLRWLDAAVSALLAGADQDPEPAQELFMALARTPVLRPVVAQAPAALHMLASHVAAHYRVPATQSAASDRPATKAIAVLISHGDAALAALASAALRAAGAGGAAALADITVRDARVSTALAAAECAPEAAAAALEASTRRAKHFLRTHADDGQAELARMAEPDGGAAEDEVKQIALRRAALVLRASVQASWEHWIEYNREHVAQQAHVTAAHGGLFMDHKMNTLCGPVLGTLASTRSTGLFATLRAPEVYLHVADGSEAQARDGLSTACCIHVAGILDNLALEAVMQFMEAQPGADARRVALLRDGFTIRRFQAQAVLYRVCGGDEAPPDTKAIVRDADAQAGICFRFEAPAPGGEVAAAVHGTYSSSTFSARSFQSIAALTRQRLTTTSRSMVPLCSSAMCAPAWLGSRLQRIGASQRLRGCLSVCARAIRRTAPTAKQRLTMTALRACTAAPGASTARCAHGRVVRSSKRPRAAACGAASAAACAPTAARCASRWTGAATRRRTARQKQEPRLRLPERPAQLSRRPEDARGRVMRS
jgi:hypothetical protein